jgi:hypothetical protein
MASELTIHLSDADPISGEALRILKRVLKDRGVASVEAPAASAQLLLDVAPGPGVQGYRIEDAGRAIRIVGHDPRGLLYGVGRFLHTSSFSDAGFLPGTWRGTTRPDCSFRGLYTAHNFHNWYREAPVADLERYVEDLALWGLNALVVPCCTNPHSPASVLYESMIPKQVQWLKSARKLGIRVGLLSTSVIDRVPDPAYAAVPVPDANPPRRGNIGDRVCLTHPEGIRVMREHLDRVMAMYEGVGLDFVTAFPYDEGGCGCSGCYPWGAKGYVRFCKMFGELARARYSGCELIAGTWCFDVREEPDGEFDGFDAAVRAEPGWCSRVMTDAHEDFPAWPLQHGSPGGLPMINFAEISMWGRWPWGGSGANPFPRRLERIWKQSRHLMDGGLPYSEGRFEDINKVTCLRLFWDKEAKADAIAREYAVAEFGPAAAGAVSEAIRLLEENYPVNPPDAARAGQALKLLESVERCMPASARIDWRWRLLLMRAIIDVETAAQPNVVTVRRNAAYEELIDINCAYVALCAVCPPAESAFARGQLRRPGTLATP